MGVDPGTRTAGIGVVDLDGSTFRFVEGIEVSLGAGEVAGRLASLLAEVEGAIAKFSPDRLVVETGFFGPSARSALRLGEARGVVLAAAWRAGIRVIEVAPAAAKRAVTGNGQAGKAQVAAMIGTMLELPDELAGSDDVTDALSLAVAGAPNPLEALL